MVAVPAGELEPARDLIRDLGDVLVVEGGATRRESVARGLERVTSARVVVHDAARPLAGAQLVVDTLNGLAGAQAVVPVLAIDESVKRLEAGSLRTIDRNGLFVSQTPQAFDAAALKAAHAQAALEGIDAGDDAELVERFGGSVATVPGSRRNIKVTLPDDFALAELLLRPR